MQIENMFTLSFLVRDNIVALVGDKQRGLCVRANGARKGAAAGGKAAMQFIIPVRTSRGHNESLGLRGQGRGQGGREGRGACRGGRAGVVV